MITEPLFPEADPQVADAIRTLCGWHIAPVVQQEFRILGDWSPFLLLPTLNLVSILSATAGGTALDVSDWQWAEDGRVWEVPRSAGPLQITVTHGYEQCPPAIKAAHNAMVKAGKLAGYSGVSIGQVRVQGAAANVDDSTGLDPYTSAILQKFTIHWKS